MEGVAIYGIVLGTVAFAACASHPQAPTPLNPSQATPLPSAEPAPGLRGQTRARPATHSSACIR